MFNIRWMRFFIKFQCTSQQKGKHISLSISRRMSSSNLENSASLSCQNCELTICHVKTQMYCKSWTRHKMIEDLRLFICQFCNEEYWSITVKEISPSHPDTCHGRLQFLRVMSMLILMDIWIVRGIMAWAVRSGNKNKHIQVEWPLKKIQLK